MQLSAHRTDALQDNRDKSQSVSVTAFQSVPADDTLSPAPSLMAGRLPSMDADMAHAIQLSLAGCSAVLAVLHAMPCCSLAPALSGQSTVIATYLELHETRLQAYSKPYCCSNMYSALYCSLRAVATCLTLTLHTPGLVNATFLHPVNNLTTFAHSDHVVLVLLCSNQLHTAMNVR